MHCSGSSELVGNWLGGELVVNWLGTGGELVGTGGELVGTSDELVVNWW